MYHSLSDYIIAITFVVVVIALLKKPKKLYHSNWSALLPNFKFSTKDFYKLVRDEMQSHKVEKLYFEEKNIIIGSTIVSAQRLYLRIKWQDYYYDLCFAPFGDGCFVSWWLIFNISDIEIVFTKTPFIGDWILRTFFRKTYYQIDSASMFMTYAQNSVLKVIDDITKTSGIRLSEDQRKPVMNNIFAR